MEDFRWKIKRWLPLLDLGQYYTIVIIILVGFGSFGLGRLSVEESRTSPIRFLEHPQAAAVARAEVPVLLPALDSGGKVVGSRSGTKYHFPWCAGAKSMKTENQVWFASVDEARAAGYTPASNCKGLE